MDYRTLRHPNADVRLKAAEYLVYAEYTFALSDFEQAITNEKILMSKKN